MGEVVFLAALSSVCCWCLVWLSPNPVEKRFYALCGLGMWALWFWLTVLA